MTAIDPHHSPLTYKLPSLPIQQTENEVWSLLTDTSSSAALSTLGIHAPWQQIASRLDKERPYGALARAIPLFSIEQLEELYQYLSPEMARVVTSCLSSSQIESIPCAWQGPNEEGAFVFELSPLRSAVHVNAPVRSHQIQRFFFAQSLQTQRCAIACADEEQALALLEEINSPLIAQLLPAIKDQHLETIAQHLIDQEQGKTLLLGLHLLQSHQRAIVVPLLNADQILSYLKLELQESGEYLLAHLCEDQMNTLLGPLEILNEIFEAIPSEMQEEIASVFPIPLLLVGLTSAKVKAVFFRVLCQCPSPTIMTTLRLLGPRLISRLDLSDIPLSHRPLLISAFTHNRSAAQAHLREESQHLSRTSHRLQVITSWASDLVNRISVLLKQESPSLEELDKAGHLLAQQIQPRLAKALKQGRSDLQRATFYRDALREELEWMPSLQKSMAQSLSLFQQVVAGPLLTQLSSHRSKCDQKTKEHIALSSKVAFDPAQGMAAYTEVKDILEKLGGTPDVLDRLEITYDDLLEHGLTSTDSLQQAGLSTLRDIASYVHRA